MKSFVIALLLGVIIGAGGLWYFQQQDQRRSAEALQDAEKRAEQATEKARQAVAQASTDVKAALAAKLEALELRAQDVREDLQAGGRIVRRKARELGAAAADAVTDAAITAEVKGRLASDPALSGAEISVETRDRRVTLTGTAPSHEAIGRAVLVAIETRGVREVVATVQVK